MNKLIKTAAALSMIASFGLVNAQKEERTQVQKPSSGMQADVAKPTMGKASGPKVDETVKQTQKPSSGLQPTTGKPGTADKVDETVKQTQKPSSGLQPTTGKPGTEPKVDETVKQTQKPGDVPMQPDARKMGEKPGTMTK